jgi:hypothetical protein
MIKDFDSWNNLKKIWIRIKKYLFVTKGKFGGVVLA